MKIKLEQPYKSLNNFESEELEPFSIITGKNGSGKSQLLNLLYQYSLRPSEMEQTIQIPKNIIRIQSEGFSEITPKNCNSNSWKELLRKHANHFIGLSDIQKEILLFVIDTFRDNDKWNNWLDDKCQISNDKTYEELYLQEYIVQRQPPHPQVKQRFRPVLEKKILRKIIQHETNPFLKIISKVVKENPNKNIKEIQFHDFFNSSYEENILDNNNLFYSSIELVFFNYLKRRRENLNSYLMDVYHKKNTSTIYLSDEEFVKKFQAPWDIINNILSTYNIGFRFKEFDLEEYNDEIEIIFEITKLDSGTKLNFADLSSGEKIILGLIVRLFTTKYYEEDLVFPQLLILDEPDAYLHPEMTKLLIDVLHNTFVKEHGIRVLMTTHSPSTVALADENSIYQLKNGTNTSLKKISKDDALKLLTSFIPTLSIDYKNHRQVFTESPTDRHYYDEIFQKYSAENDTPYKLYFMSNTFGKGNCEQVKSTVNEIRKSENETFFGCIDFDSKNKSEEYIIVHGEEKRYTIENYLYDPINLIVKFLLGEENNIHNELGISLSFNEYEILKDKDLLEKAIDWFFGKIKESTVTFNTEEKDMVRFYDGSEYYYPKQYIHDNRAHGTFGLLKKTFNSLNHPDYHTEQPLLNELTLIASKCYPKISLDTIELFENLMKD